MCGTVSDVEKDVWKIGRVGMARGWVLGLRYEMEMVNWGCRWSRSGG